MLSTIINIIISIIVTYLLSLIILQIIVGLASNNLNEDEIESFFNKHPVLLKLLLVPYVSLIAAVILFRYYINEYEL